MSIYCEFEGINGNVTAQGFEKQIEISSFNFKTERKISMQPGMMSNREVTLLKFSEIVLTKAHDISTISLVKETVSASTGKKVILHFVRTGKDSLQEFMTYDLSDCFVSSLKIFSDGGRNSKPREEIKLSYSKLVVSYTHFDGSNSTGIPGRYSYDLKSTSVVSYIKRVFRKPLKG